MACLPRLVRTAPYAAGASVGGGGRGGDFRLAATRLDTDGISRADERNGNSEEDGFETLAMTARGGLNLAPGARVEGSLQWNDADTEFDSFRFGAQGNVGDGDEVSRTEEVSGHLALKTRHFDERLDNLLLVGRAGIDRENFSDGARSFEGPRRAHVVPIPGHAVGRCTQRPRGWRRAGGVIREQRRQLDE